MSLVKVASVTLLASAALFASEGSHGQTDIIPRAVNFLIFAALVYYLLADKVKAFCRQDGFYSKKIRRSRK